MHELVRCLVSSHIVRCRCCFRACEWKDFGALEEGDGDALAVIPAEDTWDTDSTLDGWRVEGDDLNDEVPNNAGKVIVWENDTPFQTLYGTAEYGRFGYSVALSTNTRTLLGR